MQNNSSGRKVTLNKATRNWRIAFQISKFYVEPQYPRDIRNRGMKFFPPAFYRAIDSIGEHKCQNCKRDLLSLMKPAIRCDIQGQAESAFFCSEECIKLYSQKNPDIRITEEE